MGVSDWGVSGHRGVCPSVCVCLGGVFLAKGRGEVSAQGGVSGQGVCVSVQGVYITLPQLLLRTVIITFKIRNS